jgi:pyruvate ferredoxin oxidoreductase alpha subunit
VSEFKALDGNQAVARRCARSTRMSSRPTPSRPRRIVQVFAQFVADGLVDTEFVTVESEHSAMSACVGAAAAGARVMTATSSCGLALMWEILYIAASMRLPIVMPTSTAPSPARSTSTATIPIAWGARRRLDPSSSREPQEAYDNMIQAVRIAEHPDVLAAGHGHAGRLHHQPRAWSGSKIFDDSDVKDFIGEYKPVYPLLDVDNPVTYGPLDFYDYYFEHKRQQVEAMSHAKGHPGGGG